MPHRFCFRGSRLVRRTPLLALLCALLLPAGLAAASPSALPRGGLALSSAAVASREPSGPVRRLIWLPIVRRAPQPPAAPTLAPIPNASHGPTYTVSWSASGGTRYTLTENDTTIIYAGSAISFTLTNQPVGTYCYRVVAMNEAGTSAPSNSECTGVQPEAIPRPGTFRNPQGTQSLKVQSDRARLVPSLKFSIPACGASVTVELTSGAAIDPNSHAYRWAGSYYGSGTFDTASTASGNMGLSYFYVYGCGYVSGGPYNATCAWQSATVGGQPSLEVQWVAPDDGGPKAASAPYRVTVEPLVSQGDGVAGQ